MPERTAEYYWTHRDSGYCSHYSFELLTPAALYHCAEHGHRPKRRVHLCQTTCLLQCQRHLSYLYGHLHVHPLLFGLHVGLIIYLCGRRLRHLPTDNWAVHRAGLVNVCGESEHTRIIAAAPMPEVVRAEQSDTCYRCKHVLCLIVRLPHGG
jgi:hypothetical protein